VKRSSKSIRVTQPDFSNWIIKKRLQQNLSKSDLIRLAHNKISPRTIKYLEDGKQNSFREATLIDLAAILKIPSNDIFKEISKINSGIPVKSRIKNSFKKVLYIAGFIIFIYLGIHFLYTPLNPHAIKLYKDSFIVFDDAGNKIFNRSLTIENDDFYKITDLDDDGLNEVIVGTAQSKKSFDPEHKGGLIFTFNNSGKLLWQFNPFNGIFYETGGHTDNCRVYPFLTGNFYGNATKEIIIPFREGGWSTSCLITLDHNGQELARYWNSGVIENIYYSKQGNYLVMQAVNNRFKEPEHKNKYPQCIAVFKADNIKGQAPPYTGNGPREGSHLWYMQIKPTGSKIRHLIFTDFAADSTIDMEINIDGEMIYFFSMAGQLLDNHPTDGFSGKQHQFVFHD